ncbi:MAG: MarR family transcriptional regulator [Noviherbaspirillum sp.]|nr:MarR family transcriptional regulator [Noviherbaspirillum sp.]
MIDLQDRLATFNFQEYVPFLLNSATGRLLYRDKLKPRGMDLMSWRVVAVLWSTAPLKFAHLAERTAITPSTLSRVLNGLEKEGLVVRSLGEDDARTVFVSATAQGLETVERMLPHAKELQAMLLADFSADEAEFFIRMLKRIYINIQNSIVEIQKKKD